MTYLSLVKHPQVDVQVECSFISSYATEGARRVGIPPAVGQHLAQDHGVLLPRLEAFLMIILIHFFQLKRLMKLSEYVWAHNMLSTICVITIRSIEGTPKKRAMSKYIIM